MTLFVTGVVFLVLGWSVLAVWLVFENSRLHREVQAEKNRAELYLRAVNPRFEILEKQQITAGEIVKQKREFKPLKIRKSFADIRAKFESDHNQKEQRHERLVKEIEDASGKATERA